jgi:hypothetical protein
LGEAFSEPSMKLGKVGHKDFRALLDNTILSQQDRTQPLWPNKEESSNRDPDLSEETSRMIQKGVESQLGMPPYFPSSFNFFFQSLSFLGKNWMESLKSLPSPLTSSQLSPLSQFVPPLANLSFVSQSDQNFHFPLGLSLDSSTDSEENLVAYQLRNRHIPVLGDINHRMNGLGLNPVPLI